jgi:hypothetical protein
VKIRVATYQLSRNLGRYVKTDEAFFEYFKTIEKGLKPVTRGFIL